MKGPLGHAITIGLIAANGWAFSGPQNYLEVLEAQQKREAEIREIAKKMNVDPDFLLNPGGRRSFDWKSVFSSLAATLGVTSSNANANAQPLDIRESIGRVKSGYALVAADTTVARIAELVQISLAPDAVRGKKKGQIKAELQSVLRLVDKDFLPALRDGLPGVANGRDAKARADVNELRRIVKAVINAPHALDDANIDVTLAQLRTAVTGNLTVRNTKPRWTKDPFPVKDTYRSAPRKQLTQRYDGAASVATPAVVTAEATTATTSVSASARMTSNAVSSEVAALAATLVTPAKIFAWVHDNVDWESYSGVAKGARGTLAERKGNDWDQALLLRDLLSAQGYQSQLEWGTVSLPIARAMNLAGTEDPLQAANLLATAGFDGVALTANNTPIAVQMTHAWVRAFIPYVPNRGARTGTPDTWVRMDPSFKRYDYDAGIAINGRVTWSEDEYLRTSTVRPPTDFYGDKIWSYIRANNLNCQNLSQVAKNGRIHAENFPFVPSTLTARIESQGGVAADPPAAQVQRVSLVLTDSNNAPVATYDSAIADLWGRKLSLTFAPATPDDAAIINSYGGLFKTPAYLISLRPVISIDDVAVAQGAAVSAGADLDLNLTFRQPNVADDTTHHEVVAGETHTEVFDAGTTPDALITARINRLKQLTASNASEDAIVSEQLYLVGLRYMQHVDDGLNFAMGVRWQRGVKRVFEGDVRRQVNVSYNLGGAPLRLAPAENNIDISRLLVGVVPINNDQSNKAEALQLAGLESSYREAAIWEEMQSRQGISAAKALLLARIAGQQLYTVNSGNVDTVLNSVNLPSDVEAEIRGSIAQGRIAKISSAPITLGHWSGTGYILEDPQTGAATFPISGGSAGGSETGGSTGSGPDDLGAEPWLEDFVIELLEMFGFPSPAGGSTPSTTQEDPVNLSSGNMFRMFKDVAIAGRGLPVLVLRTYNSRSSVNGVFGYGWSTNYDERILTGDNGSLIYRDSDGTEHRFGRVADGSYVPPAGKHFTLTASGDGYSLRMQDGTTFSFDASGGLNSQRDTNGNTIVVHRDGRGVMSSVEDASGRTVVTFTSSAAGHITKMTDIGGAFVSYAYTGDDLTSVTDSAGKTWTLTYDLAHNLTSVADPMGHTQQYDYDLDDRVFHHVDAAGAEQFFHYDIAGRQSVITDELGGDRFVNFDDRGRATVAADAAGNVVRATWDESNNLTETVDSHGAATSYEFDTGGHVLKQTNPDGGVMTAAYDARGKQISSTDVLGNTSNFAYDASGNLIEQARTVNGNRLATHRTYDAVGEVTSVTDAAGNTSTLAWNSAGSVTASTDATGKVTQLFPDMYGRITAIQDAAGNRTSITYDARGHISTMVDPYGGRTEITYDDAGRKTSVKTPHGTTFHTYDAEGRVLTVKDATGALTRSVYDAAGNLVQLIDPRGNVARFTYDSIGRPLLATDANGVSWTFGYCAGIGSGGATGCPSCSGGDSGSSFCDITDPQGHKVHQEFDVMGRVVAVTDAMSHTVRTEYDKAGHRIAETDANGNVTMFGYDEAGHIVRVANPNGGVTTFSYDANGNKVGTKDANGNAWTFAYDALNRIVGSTDPLGKRSSLTYDVIGNLETKVDPAGASTRYLYTGHRLMGIAYPDGTTESFAYDAAGNRISAANPNETLTYTYDADGRVTSIRSSVTSLTTAYAYDAVGNLASMTHANLAQTRYTYDAKNRLTLIDDSVLGRFGFGYDTLDHRTELSYPNGVKTSCRYDADSRMTEMVSKDIASNVLQAWSYNFDAVGNRTSIVDMSGTATTYSYDVMNQLTRATGNGSSPAEWFVYDRVGNRLTKTTEGSAPTAYTYDAANRMLTAGTTTYSYDDRGNLTSKSSPSGTATYQYDAVNRLKQITGIDGSETNQYGPTGLRASFSSPAADQGGARVQYDRQANPIVDLHPNGTVWVYRVYAPGLDQPLAEYWRNWNRTTYLLHDGVGSVTAVTNSNGQIEYRQTFSSFGALTRVGTPNDHPFTRLSYAARENSVGSLMQNRARYYDTGAGRFTSRDPMQHGQPGFSEYAYANNDPIGNADPLGLYCLSKTKEDNVFGPSTDKSGNFDPLAPGFCWYKGDYAYNVYVHLESHPYDIPWWGPGRIVYGHLNIKQLKWAQTGKTTGNYGNKSPKFNIHIGLWYSTIRHVICFIIDDPVAGGTDVHFAFCADYYILGATAVAIVVIFVGGLILEAVGAYGVATGAAEGGAEVIEFIREAAPVVREILKDAA